MTRLLALQRKRRVKEDHVRTQVLIIKLPKPRPKRLKMTRLSSKLKLSWTTSYKMNKKSSKSGKSI